MPKNNPFSQSTPPPEWWDAYSNQPYKLPPSEKDRLRYANLLEYGKVALTSVAMLPLVAWQYARLTPQQTLPRMRDFAGLSISPQYAAAEVLQELVAESGAHNLLIRAPSWQAESAELERLAKFVERFKQYDLLVNVLQSRESVADLPRWQRQLSAILAALSPYCRRFQIGNAVNRSKWGCRHSGEALKLFEAAYAVQQDYPALEFLGSSVIDFEPMLTLRTLLNGANYRAHGCAAQLYVNRRGSAYGKQYGYFDLHRKIRLLASILALSNKSAAQLWITETNWPLLNTKPYTPNSGLPRSTVDEKTQAEYLTQYFTIARQSRLVHKVFWWQLINPGYGLIDHRHATLRKMPSFYAFKALFEAD